MAAGSFEFGENQSFSSPMSLKKGSSIQSLVASANFDAAEQSRNRSDSHDSSEQIIAIPIDDGKRMDERWLQLLKRVGEAKGLIK